MIDDGGGADDASLMNVGLGSAGRSGHGSLLPSTVFKPLLV